MKEKELNKDDFLKTVSTHGMEIKLENGLYRHIRYKKPDGTDRLFDLITYPGGLMFRGDMGCYVFERTEDMFTFFRSAGHGINPCYWSEKVQAQSIFGNGIMKFNLDKFREAVEDDLKEIIECNEDLDEAELRQAVKYDILDCAEDEYSAIEAIRNFTYKDEEVFPDFFQHSFESYTYYFLWCCYAIVWGIQKYDESKIGDEK